MPAQSVVLLLIGAWLLVAAAALWGMLRISRRHQQRQHLRSSKTASLRAAHARHKPLRAGH